MSYFATHTELEELVQDPAAFYAKVHGVTKAEYLDWMEDRCMAYCSATTRAGKRCRNLVRRGYQVSAKVWLELQNEYCSVHEGENYSSIATQPDDASR